MKLAMSEKVLWASVVALVAAAAWSREIEHARVRAATASAPPPTALELALLALAAVATMIGVWHRHRAAVATGRAQHDVRFAALLEQANDVIFVVAADGSILHVSQRAEEMFGYTTAELTTMNLVSLRAPSARTEFEGDLARSVDRSGRVYETIDVRRDGTEFPIEVSTRTLSLDGAPVFLAVVRDISARKLEEARAASLYRVLRTLKEINELIFREPGRQRLLDGVCAAVVAHGDFTMAWIGLVEPGSPLVAIEAAAGAPEGYVESLDLRVDDTPNGRGPFGECVRGQRHVTVEDVATDPRTAPWRDLARRHGVRSVSIAPIVSGGVCLGGLAVYATGTTPFASETNELVDEIARNLGHALWVIEEQCASDAMRAMSEEALRAAEAAARAHAADLQTVLDAVPVPMWISRDPECRSAVGNHAAYEIAGVPFGTDIGLDTMFGELARLGRVTSGGVPVRRDEIAPMRAAATNSVVRDAQTDVTFADGRMVNFHGSAAPLRDPEGRVTGVVAAFVDVTEQVRARRELEVLRRAMEHSPASVVITDVRGNIEYVNPRFCQISGYSADEVRGCNPRVLQSGQTPPETFRQLWTAIGEGREWRGEFRNRRRNGELYVESAVVSPVFDDAGRITHFLAVKEDVTERQAAEVALDSARRELAQAQKMEAVGRLAGGVAHDFNNMLAVILGYTEIALAEFARSDPRRSGLEQVRNAAERASALTRQLLTFSRKEVVEMRVLDLNAVLDATTRMLRHLIGEDIELVTEFAPETGCVRADPNQIEQIILNLAVNARDAMPSGGRLVISTGCGDGGRAAPRGAGAGATFARIRVTDTGTGIPAEIEDRVFEPFFTTKSEGRGTGLGLSTVYGIVRQAGGDVWFETEAGRGTTFHVALPHVAEPVSPDAPGPVAAPPALAGTVLLVEDDDAVRQLARLMLTSIGFRVLAASGADEAVRIAGATTERIDLLLSDVVMPRGGGVELARRIAGRIAGGRVLFMSGYLDGDLAQSNELPAGVHLLRKPFTLAMMSQKIREVMDDTRGESVVPETT